MKAYCQLKKTATPPTCSVQQLPLPKDRRFFQPEHFIWNNPYRTSPRLYPYYHAAKDHYHNIEAPRVERLQQIDKENQQKHRIEQILKHRAQSRLLLRENLQKKTQRPNRNQSRSSKSLQKIKFTGPSTTNYGFDFEIHKSFSSIKTLKQLGDLDLQAPIYSCGSSIMSRWRYDNEISLPKVHKVGSTVKKLRIAYCNMRRGEGDLRSR